ncbi:YciI family protein [Roseobacter sp.]|uniref:YciI family protein n=1 Tax=Roseobacter sp. TaxID=1907202 RepID=UPI00262E5328|nr:YciI family protein [Roseobacter sp.]MDW3181408.1 YciI family protein [Roseobacter sp.]
MTFIILFEDDAQADPDIRKTYMPAHLDFLEAHSDAIQSAGPLSDAAGAGQGGLWVVDVPDEAAAKALVHADPFWPTGLRKSFRILAWRQVFADGKRRIDPKT